MPLFEDLATPTPSLYHFPRTRYQGSKRRLIGALSATFERLSPGRAIDLYAGTATVSLLLRMLGWKVVANDFLLYNNTTARVMLAPPGNRSVADHEKRLKYLLEEAPLRSEPLVSENFSGIYFTDDENIQIDRFSQNVVDLDEADKALYIYAVGQALLMKRPYNLFHRANLSMRTKEVKRSFGNAVTWNKSILQHAVKIIKTTPTSLANTDNYDITNVNTLDLTALPDETDLVYLDPPYMNGAGLGVDYSDFYHFLDGLCDYGLFNSFDATSPHRPIISKPSAWLKSPLALDELRRVLTKWDKSRIVLSYRTDGRPRLDEIFDVFRAAGRSLIATDSYGYKYALSTRDQTEELVLLSE